jgi:tetratricopeptide (TPR) repeat protein
MRALLAFLSLWTVATWLNVCGFDPASFRTPERRADPVLLLRPAVARALALGFDAFAADLYWVGALHYAGEPKNQRVCYAQLANYIDLVNALAPDFESAYRFGGLSLPCPSAEGWRNIPEAVTVLRRGVERFPNNWFFRLLLAYDLSAYQKRYPEAGSILIEAAKIPGAPPYLGRLATRMFSQVDDFETAAQIARQLYESTADPKEREALLHRIRLLDVARELAILQQAVTEFRAHTGRLPSEIEELVRLGVLSAIPKDSLGGSWQYDSTTGKVRSTALTDSLRLFERQ